MATVHAVKQTTLKVTLELSREEAEILQSWTQNSRFDDTVNTEPPVEMELRHHIFHCLQAELK